ncbi:MAG: ribosomal protein L7/L12 [Proteobacteria bacterium]|nr:ribosomal protein L7/L12 [Pseudomonadota bacterium]
MESAVPIVAVLALIWALAELARIHARLAGTEVKLAILMNHLGVDREALLEPSEKVKTLARTPGATIEAIKAYREQTGLGLKEAKAVIDRLAG